MTSAILRGDVYICNFGEKEDHTIAKKRPVVIIQNNKANMVSSVVIVSPITSNERVGQLPVGVKLTHGVTGLDNVSYAHLGQIYTVDKGDLSNKTGSVPAGEMQRIDEAIKVSLGLEEF